MCRIMASTQGGRMLWWMVAGAFAKCQQDSADAIEALAGRVERAFDDVDDQAFAAAAAELEAAAACVRSPLDRRTLLAWHRARALHAFWDREMVASSRSWAAVKRLDPAYTPPAEWIPEGTPLRSTWEDAPTADDRAVLERVPAGGWLVDGRRTDAVPTARGFVLQGFDASGSVVHTDYHYGLATIPQVDFVALDPTVRELRRRRIHLVGTVGAGLTALGAGGMALLASSSRADALSRETPVTDTRGHAEQAGRRSNSAVGLGVASVALLATTWTIRW